jgi:hypothetical protein
MKKKKTFGAILVLVLTFCLLLVYVSPADAGDGTKKPIWQIFKDGKAKPVNWVNADNARFAVYDAGTTSDESDDVVLDKETNLVWKKIPGTTLKDWVDATYVCINEDAGGRMGWRQPTVEELMSLAVPTGVDGLSLPDGHPFSLIDEDGTQPSYWSSTTAIDNPNAAYPVCFAEGCLYNAIKSMAYNYVWCVRGGYGYDAY